MKKLLLLLCCAIALGACTKQEVKDAELIQQYISDNNLNATEASEGVYYVMNTEGTGDMPTLADVVNVDYEGFLLDGSSFDSGTGAEFPLGNLIRGWQIGLAQFKEGGSGILLIPSGLGYGSQSVGSIPKNSVLVFDITLNSIVQ